MENMDAKNIEGATNARTAWLIESENGLYIGKTPIPRRNGLGWVAGIENALQLSRKRDAGIVLGMLGCFGLALHEDAKGITEHVFYEDGSSRSDSTQTDADAEKEAKRKRPVAP